MYKVPGSINNILNDPVVRYKKSVDGITKSQFLSIVGLTGLTLTDFTDLLPVSKRTIEKVKNEELLRPDISDRVLVLGSIYQQGIDLFGSKESFNQWLHSPLVALGGEKPFHLLETSNGISLVSDVMGRLAYGVYS